jgi:uncharacterized protein (TIRG00374 family)
MMEKPTGRTKTNYRQYVINVVGILVIAALILYLYNNRNVFHFLKNIHWQQILWIIILDTVSFVIGSLQNQSLLNRFNTKVGFIDCFLLQYSNNFLNKILPTIGGGAAFRAIYLKKKYKFPYSQFVSTVAGLYVISFFSVALIGIICLWLIYLKKHQFNLVILIAFIGILLPCLFIIIFSPQIKQGRNRFLKLLSSIMEGWNIIKQQPGNILVYILFSIIILLLSTWQTLISYQALGVKVDLVSMLFLSTLGIILVLLNFTPDGIGIKEGIYLFSASLVQIPGNILVLGSLILRGISLCTTLMIGGISYWVLTQRLKTAEHDLKNESEV